MKGIPSGGQVRGETVKYEIRTLRSQLAVYDEERQKKAMDHQMRIAGAERAVAAIRSEGDTGIVRTRPRRWRECSA